MNETNDAQQLPETGLVDDRSTRPETHIPRNVNWPLRGAGQGIPRIISGFRRHITLLFSQEPTTGQYSEPLQTNPPSHMMFLRYILSVVFEALCYKPEGRDSRLDGIINFYNLRNPSSRTRLWSLLSH
jgi:hypothetical protein